MEKETKSSNLGKFRGSTPRRRDPTQQRRSTPRRGMSMSRRDREGSLDKPWVGIAKLRCGEGLRRRVTLFTNVFFVMF